MKTIWSCRKRPAPRITYHTKIQYYADDYIYLRSYYADVFGGGGLYETLKIL
jgi:hypothetical protein